MIPQRVVVRRQSSTVQDPYAAESWTDGSSAAGSGSDVSGLCFAARALAQTHPMSESALRYRQQVNETERLRQPVTEAADWAATALVVGYCLRRTEEQEFRDASSTAATTGGDRSGSLDAQRRLNREKQATTGVDRSGSLDARSLPVDQEEVAAITDALCAGAAEEVTLLAPELTLAALDRLIATELDKRNEHVREQLDAPAWTELENYVAWWVVHGYAVRAAEPVGP